MADDQAGARAAGRADDTGVSSGATPSEGEAGPGSGVDVPFRLFAGLVARMQERCRANDIRFVTVVDFPISVERQRYLRAHSAGATILVISSRLAELEKRTGAQAFIPGDGHWTKLGHEWVAQCLADSVFAGAGEANSGSRRRSVPEA